MKAKILVLALVCVFCFSLAACGDSDIQSVLDGAVASGYDDEYEIVIPDAVVNISEEDDKALTGTLTDDFYINPYFGFKINKPANGTIENVMGDGTDITPFAQTYAEGTFGIHILSRNDDGAVSASFRAVEEAERGKTEEDLIQERSAREQNLNENMGTAPDVSIETITIAGEDHLAYIESYNEEDFVNKCAVALILKGDFLCDVAISAPPELFDKMLGLIEKQ